jgi:large conductance mechanosensitive channel
MPVIGPSSAGSISPTISSGSRRRQPGTDLRRGQKAGATLGYGTFITVSVNFVIIAFVLFLLIRGMNRMIKQEAAPPPPAPPTREQELLAEIRDLLKTRA